LARKSLTRNDLYDAAYRKAGLSRAETSRLVELVLETIAEKVVAGEAVKLSSFGTFMVHKKKERFGRNPRTGEGAVISSRRKLIFKASDILKEKVNQGNRDIHNQY